MGNPNHDEAGKFSSHATHGEKSEYKGYHDTVNHVAENHPARQKPRQDKFGNDIEESTPEHEAEIKRIRETGETLPHYSSARAKRRNYNKFMKGK
jgi:hypothetical protein